MAMAIADFTLIYIAIAEKERMILYSPQFLSVLIMGDSDTIHQWCRPKAVTRVAVL